MIPATLEEFRELMRRSAKSAYYWSTDVLADEQERMQDKMDSDALASLATATPAQLLGIVGRTELETVERPDFTGKTGRYIVTPREGT